jgi:hypothetical protein
MRGISMNKIQALRRILHMANRSAISNFVMDTHRRSQFFDEYGYVATEYKKEQEALQILKDLINEMERN